MLIAVWIVSGLLALAYLVVGATKIARPKEKLLEQMTWVKGASPTQIKLVGTLEVLGALGLILPVLTHIAPILTPIAAVGLALLQFVAIIVHIRIGEGRKITPNVVLLLLAVFVAVVRFAGVA